MDSRLNKSDIDLKRDVLAELEYEPTVKVSDIGVLVQDGTVTLNGYATSFGEKWEAIQAAKRVAGVRAIADDIEVQLPDVSHRTDGDIATVVAHRINEMPHSPPGSIVITVRDGWVSLEGEVKLWYEKGDIERSVKHVTGVKGVTNRITLESPPVEIPIQVAIESALARNALLHGRKIQTEVHGNRVILRGTVRSYAEREEATRLAYAARGVFSVDDQLDVEWLASSDE